MQTTNRHFTNPMPQSRPAKSRKWRWAALLVLLLALGAAAIWYAMIPSPHERYLRGVAAFETEDLDILQQQAAALDGVAGYEPQAAVLHGMLSLRKGRLRDAVESFGKATENDETKATAFSLAGEGFYRLGRPSDARTALYQAIRVAPNDLHARRWLASACYDLGLMSEALEHLQKIAELAPSDARPDRLAGLILKDMENYTDAVERYRESLHRDPNQPDADVVRCELAECLIKTLRPAEALKALAPASNRPEVLVKRAEAEMMQGKADAAKALLVEVLQNHPDDTAALALLGTLEFDAGRYDESIEHLERAAAHEASDFEVHHRLAEAYRLAGRPTDAQRAEARSEELRQLRTQFSELHQQAMVAPQDADVRYRLGSVAVKLGRPDLGQMWFQAALAINPGHAAARQSLLDLRSRSDADMLSFGAQ